MFQRAVWVESPIEPRICELLFAPHSRQCLRTFEKAGAGTLKIVHKRSAILEAVEA
jgi:hypothetical protein